MSRVLERRKQYLRLMRQATLESGYFTVADIAEATDTPRSTVQDWVNRLIEEGCVLLTEEQRGRHAARYAATSVMPESACRRIFTTIDGGEVEIYHECMSGGCAAFCEFHHARAGGALQSVRRDGTLLRERAGLGRREVAVGLDPAPAVGIVGVSHEDGYIRQQIRCIGGPAYSLTDMMSFAEGVCGVTVHREGPVVEGEVVTRALAYVAVGIDDTDTATEGATFALALALLQHLAKLDGVMPIGHRVAMLNPRLEARTAGNSCSCIELAVEPNLVARIEESAVRFVAGEAASPEWGIAVRQGFRVPGALRAYGRSARESVIDREAAEKTAGLFGAHLYGGRGVIGALAAVSLIGLPHDVLLDPGRDVCTGWEPVE
ncbi:sugar-specific transcriptional regulator TrmB [Methanoculleus sp. YWC-01]|uniref:Sugar-specific transcriptional regulator TrmB n=1 Tax=Methanoculleus nereidis TaxID=2735141 RepID=A0ABU3Z3Y3_9EURY|nr:helix-turn-helix domain-containing protein [Methanoculleus sp. YWC-01]MCK9298702.1 sugar-specific transcriptional regulator TrmB [Methanoculleus sp.]MDV4343520.1 sugar-specific transcriptional regulator TrmB [Methanoculleus sp. YWC-01]